MKRARILLADDHRIVVEGLKSLLEGEYELAGIVEDGGQMMAAARSLRPDAIVADISMPQLNGIDALAGLRKEGVDVPVVFLTMHREVVYAELALEAGAAGYVLKHAAPEELLQAVRVALEGGTFVSPAIAGELFRATRPKARGSERRPPVLTERQREILRLFANGQSAKQIARSLELSPRTVEFHKYKLMEQLGVRNSAELLHYAIKQGIV